MVVIQLPWYLSASLTCRKIEIGTQQNPNFSDMENQGGLIKCLSKVILEVCTKV